MDSRVDVMVDDTRAVEVGTIIHEGREFAAQGFSIDVERGRMVGYVNEDRDPPHGFPYEAPLLRLTTWEGDTVALLYRTDGHYRNVPFGRAKHAGPIGWHGTRLFSYQTRTPVAGYYWYGRGLGVGMALKLRRGRKAAARGSVTPA